MCGLFGAVSEQPLNPTRLRESLESLSHRGPDLRSDWSDEQVYLGHARLSIIDLSDRGRQPMVDASQSCAIAVNGEVYNFRDLKRGLSEKYEFQSESDSEVVLHGYKEWGIEGLLQRLDGMYAICVYDKIKQKLFLARDRTGIKPLYFAFDGAEFVWASELKAIVQYKDLNTLSIDSSAIYDFLTYKYIPAPKSLYKDVFKLKPAYVLEYDIRSRQMAETCYWRLPTETKQISVGDAAEEMRHLCREAVNAQMVADVPVGFFLSGGIDSSSVVACASELRDDLSTFSIGFDDSAYSETEYARMVADRFDTNHQERCLTGGHADALYGNMRDWFDEPFGDSSALPTYLVADSAAKNATVVLTGDGGDEVFGGYQWYNQLPHLQSKTWPASKSLSKMLVDVYLRFPHRHLGRLARRLETELLTDGFALHARLLAGMTREEKYPFRKSLEIPDDYDDYWHLRAYDRPDLPMITRLQYIDFHTFLPDDILTKVDRTTMAVSIEARVPLLDTKLIEFAFSLPEEVRFHKYGLKGLMKHAMSGKLPSGIIDRGKKGFSPPPVSRLTKAIKGTLPWHLQLLIDQYPDCLPGEADHLTATG